MSINPEMLVVARESRGLTQGDLARQLGLSQGTVSKFEVGTLEPSAGDLAKIARVTEYPVEFFAFGDQVYGLADVLYRKRANVPAGIKKAIEAEANVLRMRVTRLLRGVDIESPNAFPVIDPGYIDGGPEGVARRLRAEWSLPSGPIRDVVASVEGAGGIVLCRPFGTTLVDAVIQAPRGLPPLFLLNSSIGAAGERQRFSLAHEIGHVVMRNFSSPDPEDEANRFASEFLMPAQEIAGHLDDLNLAKALRLKPYWKVSAQALIRRAYTLGKISVRRYQSLFADLSARGYRTSEPDKLPLEVPSLVGDIVESHVTHMNFDDAKMCKLLASTSRDYFSQFRSAGKPLGNFGIVG